MNGELEDALLSNSELKFKDLVAYVEIRYVRNKNENFGFVSWGRQVSLIVSWSPLLFLGCGGGGGVVDMI